MAFQSLATRHAAGLVVAASCCLHAVSLLGGRTLKSGGHAHVMDGLLMGWSHFLCAALGLKPDVVTIGEALGAGLAGVAAVLYDLRTFGSVSLPSTATMANDNLGSHVGLAVVQHLRQIAPTVLTSAAAFEHAVRAAVAPGSVCTICGSGLLQVVHISSVVMSALRRSTVGPLSAVPPCLLLHAYLQDKHRVRTRPVMASDDATDGDGDGHVAVLALEMAATASEASVGRVCTAMRDLCELLTRQSYAQISCSWASQQ